jgi:hypothetical protein
MALAKYADLLLLCCIFVVLKKLERPTPVASAFTSLTIVTNAGFLVAARIQGDALPVGQFPVILDAWMLLRMGRRHSEWRDNLVRRIEAKEFDKVVLARPFETNEDWYRSVHFGRTISDAIRRNYRFSEQVASYYLYVLEGRQ